MKSFYSPDGQVKIEFKNGLVEVHFKDKVYELRRGECDLMLLKRDVSFEELVVQRENATKKRETPKSTTPPYANSWDYHTYVKSEDCDG